MRLVAIALGHYVLLKISRLLGVARFNFAIGLLARSE
jgi:hypothetical protein